MSVTALRRAAHESVSGLPRQFWWLWTSTLINRLGGFVLTFMALYLTTERHFSASYAGLVAALIGLGGMIASLLGGVLADRIGRRPTSSPRSSRPPRPSPSSPSCATPPGSR